MTHKVHSLPLIFGPSLPRSSQLLQGLNASLAPTSPPSNNCVLAVSSNLDFFENYPPSNLPLSLKLEVRLNSSLCLDPIPSFVLLIRQPHLRMYQVESVSCSGFQSKMQTPSLSSLSLGGLAPSCSSSSVSLPPHPCFPPAAHRRVLVLEVPSAWNVLPPSLPAWPFLVFQCSAHTPLPLTALPAPHVECCPWDHSLPLHLIHCVESTCHSLL